MDEEDGEKRRYTEIGDVHASGDESTNVEPAVAAELTDNVETESAEDGDTQDEEEEEVIGSAAKRSR